MKSHTSTSGDIREYERDGYAVWTSTPKGTGVNKNEVVLKGKGCNRTAPSIARTIGGKFKEWVTRAQVIRWEKGQFIAWVNVQDDKLYEFVDEFILCPIALPLSKEVTTRGRDW